MFVKKAVVTEETPCVDLPTNKGFIFDGEKVASTNGLEKVKPLSKILDTKENQNELEYSKPI